MRRKRKTTSAGAGGGRCWPGSPAGLRGRPDVNRILSFDEVVTALGWHGEHYLGPQAIQLDTVAGTVESRRDFDRSFRAGRPGICPPPPGLRLVA